MSEEHTRAFLRRHIAGLQVELDRKRKVLTDIDGGAVRHLDAGRLRADVAQGIRSYEHSITMWTADLDKLERS